MSGLTIDIADAGALPAKMKVVGVGGAGGNALNRMIAEGLAGVEFVAVNTDEQALENCAAPTKIRIGSKATQGLGAGADPDKGRRAVEEDRNAVYEALADADMVFVAAGMGGGTGTGAAPVVAEISRDIGALTVGVVTKPFMFEGPKRMQRADEGIQILKENVDTLIQIPNQRLLSIVPDDTPLDAAFRYADEILFSATKGVSDLISIPGLVNLDFADVRAVMSEMGDALMGSGMARGENRAKVAAEQAIKSPLLENVSISGALGVLVNITGGTDLTLKQVNTATSIIFEEAGPNANIIFGAVIDKELSEEIRITVIATGLSAQTQRRRIPGLNRQPISTSPANGSVDEREIPAIDRISKISETMGKEKSTRIQNGHTQQHETTRRTIMPSEIQEKKSGQEQFQFDKPPEERPRYEQPRILKRQDEDIEREQQPEKEKRQEKKKEHRFGSIDFEKDANGIEKEDYEIPAYRRRRWNFF